MALNAAWPLQEAVHSQLIADTAILANLQGPHVYDMVPRGVQPPYIVFQTLTSVDRSAIACALADHTFVLTIWTDQPGRRALAETAREITTVLENVTFEITPFTVTDLRIERTIFRPVQRSGRFVLDIQFVIRTQETGSEEES